MASVYRLCCVALLVVFGCGLGIYPGSAQTRRAFVVGITKYKDPGIQPLSLATQDAEDIAKDLKEAGFDEKNIKQINNPASRESFITEFNKFVGTIKEGDVVFFYFSGHGYGGRGPGGQTKNFLLFADIKSPIEFARGHASDSERKLPQLVKAKSETRELLADYEMSEVPTHGMSETDILAALEQKKPRVSIIVIDACRTLLSNQSKGVGRVGTNLNTVSNAPSGFMIIYSAAHGQQAIEKFGDSDQRRNSLFTSVFREFLVKPGMDLTRIAKRVRDKVSQLAQSVGFEQDPDYNDNIRNGEFYFIDPVGADRYELGDDPCVFAHEDMREIRERPRRERLERHLRYFGKCPTATEAKQLLNVLAHGASDAIIVEDAAGGRSINPCDRLAASEEDPARPSDVSGVPYGRMDVEAAIAACNKAVEENPRVVRYLFNLARAYQRKGLLLPPGPAKQDAQRAAFIRYQDAVSRGYVAALNNLAIIYDSGEGASEDPNEATRLFRQGADQGHPLAMYNLALRYRSGKDGKDGKEGLQRDFSKAFDLFARAAEAGNIAAMVQVGVFLRHGLGTKANPVRAVEWLRRAANAGSNDAKRELGFLYFFGGPARDEELRVPPDTTQALLWFAQAAENGDPDSQRAMAYMFEEGNGINSPQPQVAERYWRLAAYSGSVPAQVEFAERILSQRVLVKPENGPGEVVQLLRQAMTLGSSQAALRLAKIYRKGEMGYEVRPEEAVKYAYRAIDLASQAGGRTEFSTLDNPLDEIAAGILLAEMAANHEAVNSAGQPLLTEDERARLERYYGKPDPELKQVKARWLRMWLDCGGRPTPKYLWVWDWGRDESPTEAQFRYYEAQRPPCRVRDQVVPGRDGREGKTTNIRLALVTLWDVVRKDPKLSFPEVVAAQAEGDTLPVTVGNNAEEKPSSRRHRRHR